MISIPDYVKNLNLRSWVEESARLCQPDDIHWCDGSDEEYKTLCDKLVASEIAK